MGNRKVILVVEKSRAYGRSVCEGIVNYATHAGNWSLASFRPERLTKRDLASADGVIARIESESLARRLQAAGIPVIDLYGSRIHAAFHRVDCDHAETGRLAAEYFLGHRYRNCAFCGFDGLPFSDTKRSAYAAALKAGGVDCLTYRSANGKPKWNNLCFDEDANVISDRTTLIGWLRRIPKPVAVFCCSDVRAAHVVALARELKLRVPQEIAVLGVDDDRLLCTLADPPISSISRYAERVGETAARTLERLMDGAADVPPLTTIPSGPIVERASTLFYPLEPPWLAKALAYIDANVHAPIDANAVFNHVNLSHTLVERTFGKVLGQTVSKRILETKVREAERHLLTTDLRIFEIANELGFSSAATFCRVFHRLRGQTPKSLRRQPQKI